MRRRHTFAASLLAGLCGTLSSFAVLAGQPAHAPRGLAVAPPGLVAAIARTEAQSAAHNAAYVIDRKGCAALRTDRAAPALEGCFSAAGAAFTSGNERIGLHLAAWGRAGHPRAVRLTRATAKANRIDYQGKGVSEWWRVLPMGYEQGFTIDKAPAGRGEVVLQLQANRAPEVRHGTLVWGHVRYGKLYVTDATGKALPSHLIAHGQQITLVVDARHARYPIRVDPLIWSQQQALTASDGAPNDWFGASVALSADGGTALVGAYYKTVGSNSQQGAAYIYTLSGGRWSQVAELTASDGVAGDMFGFSVALDGTGTTALVGAQCAPPDSVTNTCGPGAAYVFTKPAGGWATTSAFNAKLTEATGVDADYFGSAVALSSDGATALVGAYCASATTTAGGLFTCGTGYAYIFVRPGSSWGAASTPSLLTQTTAIVPSNGVQAGDFGRSVALSGNGNTAVVGADANASGNGAAYVFTTTDNWTTPHQAAELTASDGATGDELGYSVALSSDGATALAGAYCAPYQSTCGPGAAYVFTEPVGGWTPLQTENARLTASDGAAGDELGISVALSSDGGTALVGARSKNVGGNMNQGAAYVFTRPGSGWGQTATPSALQETSEITASDGANGDLGASVALSGNGAAALVGADGTSSAQGAAYAFTGTAPTSGGGGAIGLWALLGLLGLTMVGKRRV